MFMHLTVRGHEQSLCGGWNPNRRPSCTPSKRDTRLRYSPNLRNNVLILAQGLRRTFRDSRASRLAGCPEALALPRRYQATINLLKTHDKLARARDLMAARLGRLPHRYLFECHGCCGALCVV